ncbi:aspartate-semialdehyde dehydrogenase [Pseudomonas sp. RP23018S]|uniref:aspartate-semialdehyde dehydrogenase n=1 Tax=Pseudomonas sp. RP23018S TaxID=3096037 RepID=UPI002ACAB8F0|nr:aspartate-semialdehyde dehydrogenase [Pseudomonas sp. RP23018S]MDZ5603621.1 aspartate-semialdehyde dehydrogenase [Pseudomonas sp. RP23018S]
MLPPLIPLSAVPVTSQLDPVKPTPDIPPVVPVQTTAGDSSVDLRQRHDPQEQALLLFDEQRRHQQRQQQEQADRYSAEPGDQLNADNTVPVMPMGEPVRQGLLVDIEV